MIVPGVLKASDAHDGIVDLVPVQLMPTSQLLGRLLG
jgi:hypothetical protein